MALGPLTYKTINQITYITSDLSGFEGCGVTLNSQGTIGLSTVPTEIPYSVVVVGAASVDGNYTGQVAAGALEIIDAYGATCQVLAGASAIAVGDLLQVNGSAAFIVSTASVGEYIWGVALTAAPAGGQFLMRFAPYIQQV